MVHLPYRKDLRQLARQLRAETTPVEAALWSRLRRKQVLGLRFHRQKPILDFIVDFYCPKAGLVIEIDGRHHGEDEQAERDGQRAEILRQLDLVVVRFSNEQITEDLDGVVDEIRRVVVERMRR